MKADKEGGCNTVSAGFNLSDMERKKNSGSPEKCMWL